MEAKTETFIKTSVDDNGMWLLTVPAGRAGDETVVVVVRRVEECRYGSEDSPGAHVSITSSLTLYGEGQGTPQTIVAKFVPGTVELFSVEFMLKEFYPVVAGWAAGSCSRWCSGPAPAAGNAGRKNRHLVRGCENIRNLIRRSRMARAGVPVPGRGNQLNAAAGRRTAVAAGQVFNAPGGAPGIRGTPAGRLLSRAAGKNRAARRQKTVAKTVNYFT
jgi:hypothetical protein